MTAGLGRLVPADRGDHMNISSQRGCSFGCCLKAGRWKKHEPTPCVAFRATSCFWENCLSGRAPSARVQYQVWIIYRPVSSTVDPPQPTPEQTAERSSSRSSRSLLTVDWSCRARFLTVRSTSLLRRPEAHFECFSLSFMKAGGLRRLKRLKRLLIIRRRRISNIKRRRSHLFWTWGRRPQGTVQPSWNRVLWKHLNK